MGKQTRTKSTLEICRDKCRAECCKYFMVKIDPPRTRADRDEHRWFLMHEGVELRIEGRKWYMLVHSRCKNLTPNSFCRIYGERPDLCEDYDEESCDSAFRGGPAEGTVCFRTVDEYDDYMARRGKPWRPRRR